MALHLLVAVDESGWQHAVLSTLADFATRLPETPKIIGLHVLPVTRSTGKLLQDLVSLLGFEPTLVPAQVEELYRQRGKELLEHFRSYLAQQQLESSVCLEQGSVLDKILYYGNHSDLVLVGSRGETEEAYPGRGGTVERLVRRLSVPALIVPLGGVRIRRIAIAYDGSEGSMSALRVGSKLSSWLQLPCRLLCVGRPEQSLTLAMGRLEEYGVQGEVVHLEGEPQEAIPAELETDEVLVIGARGRITLGPALGRVTEALLELKELPLLVAR